MADVSPGGIFSSGGVAIVAQVVDNGRYNNNNHNTNNTCFRRETTPHPSPKIGGLEFSIIYMFGRLTPISWLFPFGSVLIGRWVAFLS